MSFYQIGEKELKQILEVSKLSARKLAEHFKVSETMGALMMITGSAYLWRLTANEHKSTKNELETAFRNLSQSLQQGWDFGDDGSKKTNIIY